MSALIIAYGPGGSGKSIAAWLWRSDIRTRVIIEEGNFTPATITRVVEFLDAGNDVWMNLTTKAETLNLDLGPNSLHDVEFRRFHPPASAPLPTAEEALSEIRGNATSLDSAMSGDGFAAALTRWLAQHDAAIAAKTLRDAADEAHTRGDIGHPEGIPAEHWLTTKARLIEKEAA